ncbi:MAG: alpha/beta fold hydrolase [Schleiferiaceae bacterium]|nr:alpha/beta fold hydrolase [Schleiferiaceae bacterium]
MQHPSPIALLDSRFEPCKSGELHPQEVWLLHGYASNQDDLFGFAPYLSKAFSVRSLRATQPLDFGGYAWYALSFDEQGIRHTNEQEALRSIDRVAEALHWYALEHPDSPRPILVGFSQGGILSNAIATKYPELIKAVAAIASYFPVEWSFLEAPVSPVPHWLAIGSEDGVVPTTLSLPSFEKAKSKFGIPLEIKTYPMPHTISPACFNDLVSWLKKQLD